MKALMMSIKPKYVAKILNQEKTIEVRKKFPSDYQGWVYIYCTKDKKYANLINRGGFLTGMVVARFWCDKVEEIELNKNHFVNEQYSTDELNYEELLEKSCLTYRELDNYLQCEIGYAIHITKLEIFDKPKDISVFSYNKKYKNCSECLYQNDIDYTRCNTCIELVSLTRPPQSWCYIEI